MTGSSGTKSVAGTLAVLVAGAFGGELPIRLRAWDGSEAGAAAGPVLVVGRRRAVRRLLQAPGVPGFTQAYVAGDIDIEGDLAEALSALWAAAGSGPDSGSPAGWVRWWDLTARLGILGRRPPAPSHDNLPTAFFELVLGRSMTRSCGYFANGSAGGQANGSAIPLATAQQANLDLICRKLGLGRATRHLDMDCGWGALICHAAEHYGARSTGLTSSRQQYDYVRNRVADAGLDDRVQVRLVDHDALDSGADDEQFDAVSAVEFGDHIGDGRYPAFAGYLHRVLRPGGRALLQQVSPGAKPTDGGNFVKNNLAPDLQLRPVGTTVSLLGAAGLDVQDVLSLRKHYGWTMTAWAELLERSWNGAIDLIGEAGTRAWQLYLVGGALAFSEHRLGVEQILAVRPPAP